MFYSNNYKRYTNADLINRLGIQDELEQHLFGPGGHWEIS